MGKNARACTQACAHTRAHACTHMHTGISTHTEREHAGKKGIRKESKPQGRALEPFPEEPFHIELSMAGTVGNEGETPRVMATCREPGSHFLSPAVPSSGLGAESGTRHGLSHIYTCTHSH